jgi:hypothetical protein
MADAHTPGPWSADNFGLKVFTVGSPYGHGSMNIADVRGWGHLTGQGACALPEEVAAEIQHANARLIAAAPDLLAALKWAKARLEALVTEDQGNGAFLRGTSIELAGFGAEMKKVSSAIQKAEG